MSEAAGCCWALTTEVQSKGHLRHPLAVAVAAVGSVAFAAASRRGQESGREAWWMIGVGVKERDCYGCPC